MTKSLEEIKETFDYFDKDKNGSIDRDEFVQLLSALGVDYEEEEINAGWDILDTNRNGLIDYDEFINWWQDQ